MTNRVWIWNHIIYKPIAFFNQRSNSNHKLSTNFAVQIQVPTFSNGMCMSLKVSLGVIKAVSNSSTVNSQWIFNSGQKTCSSQKQKLKSQNATICKILLTEIKPPKLTCKKLSTDASSHFDRRFQRGNWEGDGSSTSVVTILLHCCCWGDSSFCCSFFGFGFRSTTVWAAKSRSAARMVQAREGRFLLAVGCSLLVVVVVVGSFSAIRSSLAVLGLGLSMWESGSGEDRSQGIGGGEESCDMVGEITNDKASFKAGWLHVKDPQLGIFAFEIGMKLVRTKRVSFIC